ncbi:MAG TPA: 50S ribosomal protein L11 methyltransferase [Pyrinomonadaceae bacterium]|nr:50S ribosomal protein L11 methyltransferase [Pyrinomonadaceae bacterium]
MYSVHSYGRMLADTPRMEAYSAALQRAVRPGSVVLDLGCGPGVFALLACKLGARRVYAVEPDDVIQLAREAARANHFEDRIEFFQKLSTEITLPEPADVIISDLRGCLPWYQQHIPSIVDARKRLLAPNGTLLPRRDILWAAIVEAPDRYQKIVAPWQSNGLDLSAGRRVITNTWRKTRIEPGELLVQPTRWATVDYYEIETPNIRAQIEWQIARSGTAHGLAVWFDSELIDEIGFSNHPSGPELIYGNGLFPFSMPVEVVEGDRIQLTLSADFIRDDYVWRWDSKFFSGGDSVTPKANFKQSTFYGVPLSPEQMQKQAASYKPSLDQRGQVRSFILEMMTGENSLAEIAARLADRFPHRYADLQDALNEVTVVSREFGQ